MAPRQKKSTKNVPQEELTLEQHIDRLRTKWQTRLNEIDRVKRDVANAQRTAEKLTARWQIHARRRMEEQIAKTQQMIEWLGEGHNEFEIIAGRYSNYAKQQRAYWGWDAASVHITADQSDEPDNLRRKEFEQKLVREFLSICDDVPPPVVCSARDYCRRCLEMMKVCPSAGLLICPLCGFDAPYLDATSASQAYGDEVEIQSFDYKRKSHFSDKLSAFQAKESTQVPPAVLESIMSWLFVNEGCRHPSDVTFQKVQLALKALKLKGYYDNRMQITCIINGKTPPYLSPQDEERCKRLFDAMQEPYDRHKSDDRANFLSYNYCIFQFFRMLGLYELLPYFSLLKGKDKLEQTEAVFKLICEDLDWEFSSAKEGLEMVERLQICHKSAPSGRNPAYSKFIAQLEEETSNPAISTSHTGLAKHKREEADNDDETSTTKLLRRSVDESMVTATTATTNSNSCLAKRKRETTAGNDEGSATKKTRHFVDASITATNTGLAKGDGQ